MMLKSRKLANFGSPLQVQIAPGTTSLISSKTTGKSVKHDQCGQIVPSNLGN